MPIDRKLLEILRCPVTKQDLHYLSESQIEKINASIDAGELNYADGSAISEPLVEGLITANGVRVYRIDDGIPIMLEDQSIVVDQMSVSSESPPAT
jgi:uncharacterized protein YbaR (Trm112 family)